MRYNKFEAQTLANNLCKKLGDGWTPVVWENLGWHYKAVKGFVTMREYVERDDENRYRAELNVEIPVRFNDNTMGLASQTFARSKTYQEALDNLSDNRDAAIRKLTQISKLLYEAEF